MGFPGGSAVKNPPVTQKPQDIWVQFLGQEDPLVEGMATHSSILSWRIPRTEEPGGLQSMGSERVGHNWSDLACMHQSVSSFAQSCLTLCDPMNCSMPGLPVHHKLPEFTQVHAHRVGDAIQPSHPLSSSSPPAPNPSQHQGLFQWVNFSHEVAKILEFQLQHQSFQWTPRADLL